MVCINRFTGTIFFSLVLFIPTIQSYTWTIWNNTYGDLTIKVNISGKEEILRLTAQAKQAVKGPKGICLTSLSAKTQASEKGTIWQTIGWNKKGEIIGGSIVTPLVGGIIAADYLCKNGNIEIYRDKEERLHWKFVKKFPA